MDVNIHIGELHPLSGIYRACVLKNPGEPKIAPLKGLWRAVRWVITMKNYN